MLLLQKMQQDNANFQANITTQLTQQISTQLEPIFTQVDRLTLQVEHGTTHAQFNELADEGRNSMWVNPEETDEIEESDMETEETGENGFAPVRGKKKGNGKGKSAGAIHTNIALKKSAGA